MDLARENALTTSDAQRVGISPDELRTVLLDQGSWVLDGAHAFAVVAAFAVVVAAHCGRVSLAVAFAQRTPSSSLFAARPLWQQLSIVTLAAGSPVDALASLLRSTLSPLLNGVVPRIGVALALAAESWVARLDARVQGVAGKPRPRLSSSALELKKKNHTCRVPDPEDKNGPIHLLSSDKGGRP